MTMLSVVSNFTGSSCPSEPTARVTSSVARTVAMMANNVFSTRYLPTQMLLMCQ
jgi:hypothetical protein